MISKIKQLFLSYPVQTFTYFIPAPPDRKHGYREKSFDQLIQKLTKMDFKLVDIKTQAVNNNSVAGMWVIVSLKPLSKIASQMKVSDFPNDWENEEIQKNNEYREHNYNDHTYSHQNLAQFPMNEDNNLEITKKNKSVLKSSEAKDSHGQKVLEIELPQEKQKSKKNASDKHDSDHDSVEGLYYID